METHREKSWPWEELCESGQLSWEEAERIFDPIMRDPAQLRQNVRLLMLTWAKISECGGSSFSSDSVVYREDEKKYYLVTGYEEICEIHQDQFAPKKYWWNFLPVPELLDFLEMFPESVREIARKMKRREEDILNSRMALASLAPPTEEIQPDEDLVFVSPFYDHKHDKYIVRFTVRKKKAPSHQVKLKEIMCSSHEEAQRKIQCLKRIKEIKRLKKGGHHANKQKRPGITASRTGA